MVAVRGHPRGVAAHEVHRVVAGREARADDDHHNGGHHVAPARDGERRVHLQGRLAEDDVEAAGGGVCVCVCVCVCGRGDSMACVCG